MKCQACSNDALTHILSLGYMPPVNDMRPVGKSATAQIWLPTDLMFCDRCELVQLAYVGDPSVVFPPSYPYTSGSTKILRDNFAELAQEARRLVDLKPDDLVIDIGSNDGTLLSNFKGRNQIIGIEPTNIATIANDKDIQTYQLFFSADAAKQIKHVHGQAKLIICCNCFAHMDNIHDVIDGVLDLLAPDGVFVSESTYLIDTLEQVHFDVIYHEHLRYYSLTSLRNLLAQHGLHVFYAKKIPTHGGSIRVYAKHGGNGESIDKDLLNEPTDVLMLAKLMRFADDVKVTRATLMEELFYRKHIGDRIVGISAPSRASTVVNYCRIDESLLDYVCEVEGSRKIGRYMPGTNIHVVEESALFEDQPECALLFSHHIADELIPKLRAKGYRGEFIKPL